MTQAANLFESAVAQAFKSKIKWATDAIKMILLTATATPLLTWNFYSTVSHEVATGSGYTTGGKALSSCTVTTTKANTWGVSRAATTAYTLGQLVRPASANTWVYRCVVAGTTASGLPTYPTVAGETVTDGTVRWANAGQSATVLTSTPVQWTPSTISAAYGIIVDTTPGSSATDPLVALINFGATKASTNGPFKLSPDAHAGWGAITPY